MNIARILNSSKFQAAAVASVPPVIAVVFAALQHTPLSQMQPLVVTALLAIMAVWAAAIHGTAMEDAATPPTPPGTTTTTTTTAVPSSTVVPLPTNVNIKTPT